MHAQGGCVSVCVCVCWYACLCTQLFLSRQCLYIGRDHKDPVAHVQVEKEVVKAIRQMEEVEVEVKKKKEVSSRVKQLRRQVSLTFCS